MTDKREMTRAEARQRRALAKDVACQKAGAICESVGSVVNKARLVLATEGFVEILRSQGIQTLPRCLATNAGLTHDIGDDPKAEKDRLDEVSLEFVIVWTFLFPLVTNPAIAINLEKMWPGFIQELKDAFITLVVEGPFPHAMSGHRGRRHGAHYHSGSCRRSKSH